jgi:Putative rhamnosyl transferase
MDHVVLTRFNLPSKGAESYIRAKDGWLAERVELFETYCLPSVVAQTDRRSKWIIYFDPESPQWLLDRIKGHGDAYTPVFRAEVSRAELRADIAALFEVKSAELLTTNLDNDDGLAADFVARLCVEGGRGQRAAYYLSNGLIKSPTGLYGHRDPHNAFVSVREGWDEPITCWGHWHNKMHQHMPVVELGGAPGWLQVVHGGNVSNRTRGRLVSPVPHRRSFGASLDDVAEPDGRTLVRDRVVGQPVRVVRDSGRVLVKNAAMKLLGKSGFERAKQLLAARKG